MNAMSLAAFEDALNRVGMQVRGGNLSEAPWSGAAGGEGGPVGNVAWAGRDVGIFVVDWAPPNVVELDTLARKDVLICSVVLDQEGAWTDFAVGDNRFDAKGADMTMVFVPQRERFQFVTSVPQGLKAVTIVVDLLSLMIGRGLRTAALPKSLLRMIQSREVAMETLAPGHFGEIARDVAARRAMFPSLATLYYEGKTFELVSALMSELSRRDDFCAGDGDLDPDVLERLGLVKHIIDQAPHRILDVDDLARTAALNRTKLRSAFKRVYGTTLSGYRTTILLQRANCALKQAGVSVKQAARHAGYANTSSFIIAYKRQYGVRPGIVLRDEYGAASERLRR
jgi:AraC-like DNA-binding protein